MLPSRAAGYRWLIRGRACAGARINHLQAPPYDPAVPLEPGVSRDDDFTVEGVLLTDVGGTIGVSVLSTPGLVGMIERNAALLAYEHLPEGKATVGFEVCIKHVAGAVEGARCRVSAVLREVVDGRKLRFDVEVLEGDRTIGVGTHERRVIDVAAHAGAAGS
jgi:fluoroacetyl-CoA thioesterase